MPIYVFYILLDIASAMETLKTNKVNLNANIQWRLTYTITEYSSE